MSKWMSIDPRVLAGTRAWGSALILGAVLLLFRRRELRLENPRRDLWFLAVFGVGGLALMQFTYFKAISITGVSVAILLEYLAPILTLAVGVLFQGQRLKLSAVAGIALALTGAALVVGIFSGHLTVSVGGLLWGLASAVGFASYSLLGVAGARFRPLTLLFYGLFAGALFWLVVLGPRALVRPFYDPLTACQLLFLCVVATIIPFALFLQALRHISATEASVAAMIEPVLAAVGGMLLFAEPFSWALVAGGVLIIAAVLLIQLT
jgi:drug/metabolite transporter (DMT)-like permease